MMQRGEESLLEDLRNKCYDCRFDLIDQTVTTTWAEKNFQKFFVT